jgi:hypothetical protein
MTEKSLTTGGKEDDVEGDREGLGSRVKNFRRFLRNLFAAYTPPSVHPQASRFISRNPWVTRIVDNSRVYDSCTGRT